ncbi:15346_t:CDS:2 [Rhizophagus irregularis]|nr:15346_t:CDS:2 [Rhizophagus irregularis]
MQQEFYSLFMKKCPELRYLDMRSIKHQIFCFPEAKVHLESLYELRCDTSIDSSYYYGLSRSCHYIQKLIIDNINPKPNYGIVKLIEVQKNLKHFEWKDDFFEDYLTEDPYGIFLLALEKKADSLNYLRIFFRCIYNITERAILQMILPKFHKLKTLIIEDGFLSFTDEQPYDTIDFEFDDLSFHESSLNFIRKIYENCPLIEYLSIAFSPSKENFTEFEKLLKNCKNLKSLLLIICNIYEEETEEKILENGEELLKVLISSTPSNLKEIRFYDYFKFSLENLEEFLGKWRGCTLSMLTSDSFYERDDYKKLISKYKNDGVIKDFKYISELELNIVCKS